MREYINAKIVQHTRSGGTELITLEVECPKFILPQLNTHRTFSRSYQSSRAMPVLKQMEQIKHKPFMPIRYGTAQQGMVAGEPLTGFKLKLAKGVIYSLSRVALLSVKILQKLGLSKEVANRYLEPWMNTKGIITATREAWEAFFKLRCNYDAQPEIQYLANSIKNQIDMSNPFELKPGEWHVPYHTHERTEGGMRYTKWAYRPGGGSQDVREVVRSSTAGCAQVSYRTLDLSPAKTERVYKMLNLPEDGVWPEEPPHFSASEHCAMACIPSDADIDCVEWNYSGNFHTTDYIQYRKMLEHGCDGYFLPTSEDK